MTGWTRSLSKCLSTSFTSQWKTKLNRSMSSTKLLTLADVISDLHVTVGSQKVWRPSEFDRSELEAILPKSQSELPPQKMSRSYGEAIVPIGVDEMLRQKYLNHTGTVRIGRIMEDLDAFAVWVCYRHLFNPKQKPGMKSPFCVVTALVDKINLTSNEVEANKDIKFTGQVTWAGKTSLETRMKLWQTGPNSEWKEVAHANFVMVARDPLNRGSAVVNKVIAETEEENFLLDSGQLNSKLRKEFLGQSLIKVPPTEAEREEIHSLFLSTLDKQDDSFQSRLLPQGCVWMEEAEVSTTILCHPEQRNFYNKIFGGLLMRRAFELAWISALVHSQSSPLVRFVDDICFRRPVEIGDVMFLNSKIVFVLDAFIQVRVVSDVYNPDRNERYTTNVFQFTFAVPKGSPEIHTVMPRTYSEAMLYLDGKRHFEVAMKYHKPKPQN